MLIWCKGSSNWAVCVYGPARGKAGKAKSPISTLDVVPKALPVCHLKKQKTKISYHYNFIYCIDTEIPLQLADLWHI